MAHPYALGLRLGVYIRSVKSLEGCTVQDPREEYVVHHQWGPPMIIVTQWTKIDFIFNLTSISSGVYKRQIPHSPNHLHLKW